MTISRQMNLPVETLDHMAKTMNHRKSTADEFYDFNSLDVSVRETLLTQSQNTISTPIKALQTSGTSSSYQQGTGTFGKDSSNSFVRNDSSMELSKIASSVSEGEGGEEEEEEANTASMDDTIKNLRSKKIKRSKEFNDGDIAELKIKIAMAISSLKDTNDYNSLKNSKGTLCISKITKLVPEARGLSVKKLRAIISDFMQ